jgi:hypothetical protein
MAILSLLFQGEVWREALPWVASAIVACFTIVLARGERPHYGFPLIGMEYSRFGRMDYEKALARFLGGLTKIYQTGLREVCPLSFDSQLVIVRFLMRMNHRCKGKGFKF